MKRPSTRYVCLCLFLLLSFCMPASASGTWRRVEAGEDADLSGFMVSDYSGTVSLTFLGDCTLGGEESNRSNESGFFAYIKRNGYSWPFRNLTAFTAADDLTIANLEGVLTDRNLVKEDKTYNFSGPTAYTAILTAGSIECVSLANNHAYDYGSKGLQDTQAALQDADICFFDTEQVAVWQNEEGLRIGFCGAYASINGRRKQQLISQLELLESLGCHYRVVVMHAGVEYESIPSTNQRRIVEVAKEAGANLVVGHHPHVVQGYEWQQGSIPVVYSLGNCSFGGNAHPKETDALVLQVQLCFEENELQQTELHFWPIAITGKTAGNDYSPVLLEAEDARKVLERMEASTGYGFTQPYSAEEGAVVSEPTSSD